MRDMDKFHYRWNPFLNRWEIWVRAFDYWAPSFFTDPTILFCGAVIEVSYVDTWIEPNLETIRYA